MAQRSQAMRLNSRGWSKTVELRIDVASTPLVAPTIHVRVAIALAARWRGNFTKRFCAERDERSAKEPQARTVDESSLWLTGTPQPRPARPGTKPQKSRRTLDPHLLPSEDSAVTGFLPWHSVSDKILAPRRPAEQSRKSKAESRLPWLLAFRLVREATKRAKSQRPGRGLHLGSSPSRGCMAKPVGSPN